jgi:dihydroflavonol-4-reductase
MLNAARKAGVKRFIHFSSIHAFNQQPHNDVLDEQRSLVGEDAFAYDKSKAEGERMVLDAAREGFDAFVISPTAIIGPMDYEPGLLGQAFLQIYHHRIPALVPGGYDMVDVRDIVAAAITAIEKGKKGEKYLLSGKWHSIKEISMIIENFTGKKTIKTEMPFWAARLGLPFIFLFSRITGRIPLYTSESLSILINASRHISNEKARRELGFNPRPVKETIEDLFTWFGQNGNLTK